MTLGLLAVLVAVSLSLLVIALLLLDARIREMEDFLDLEGLAKAMKAQGRLRVIRAEGKMDFELDKLPGAYGPEDEDD